MKTKILLADDHQIVLDGLRSLIEKLDGMEVAAAVKNGREAVARARECRPDVCVIDITMPELNGLDAAQQIRAQVPGCAVIVLSMHSDKGYVAKALQTGASGYLLKNGAFRELETAIRAVLAGRVYLSPEINELVVEDYIGRVSRSNTVSDLTSREREIVQLVAEGYTSKQIAGMLSISARTVEVHRRNVMAKLNFQSTADLTRFAIREGLTSAEM